MKAYEDVLYAIRADLGHESKAMQPGALLSLFVTDARDYFPLK